MTFSDHAAQHLSSNIYYGLLFTVTLPVFYIFVDQWFVPNLSLPIFFTWLIAFGCIGQFIAGWVAGTTPLKTRIHTISAFFMHIMLLPMIILLLIYGELSLFSTLWACVAVAYMFSMWIYFSQGGKARSNVLLIQSTYVIAFHSVIVATTYLA